MKKGDKDNFSDADAYHNWWKWGQKYLMGMDEQILGEGLAKSACDNDQKDFHKDLRGLLMNDKKAGSCFMQGLQGELGVGETFN